MDYKTFFIDKNKSGYKTKEIYLYKNFPNLHKKIIDFNSNELEYLPFKQKIWHFINNVDHIPTCNYCNIKLKFKRSLTEGYGSFCSISCNNKSEVHIQKVKKTNNQLYGGNAPISSEIVKNKIKQTNLNKYGVDNIFRDTNYIKEKTISKHGVNHISKLESTKEKIIKTNIDRYSNTTLLLLPQIRYKYLIKQNQLLFPNLHIVKNDGIELEIKCSECSNNYTTNRYFLIHRYYQKINPCTICNPVNELVSIKEKEFMLFLTSLNIEFESNNRTILEGREIDIYIPSHNLAIEFNGLYYHSELFKNRNYHLNKTLDCESKGIQLIHIFEDEWDYKREIVQSRIKNLLKISDQKIYARKCSIKHVPTKQKTQFLNDNHIQGSVGSSINLGLYHNGELVSILTFSKGRNILKGNKYEYELIRFCNKLNSNVVGGASKLLNYFVENYKPKEIISYADIRWSNGNLYSKLGFNLISRSSPNYYYILNRRRTSRLKFKKHILVSEGYDKSLSESEIMLKRGIYRIFDCGNLVYKKTFN